MLSGAKRDPWHLKAVHLSVEVEKFMVLNVKRLGEMSKQNAAHEKEH